MTVPVAASVRHFLLIHRRLLAAVFASLAVFFGLGAVRPSVEGAPVVVVRHDLAAGTVLASADLQIATFPAAAKPEHTWTTPAELVGRRVAAPMRDGEAVTDFRLLEPGLLAGYANGMVLSTISIADVTELAGLRVGDHVNIVGSDPRGEAESALIVRRAEVVSLPRIDNRHDVSALAVVVSEAASLKLAAARLRAQLSVVAVS